MFETHSLPPSLPPSLGPEGAEPGLAGAEPDDEREQEATVFIQIRIEGAGDGAHVASIQRVNSQLFPLPDSELPSTSVGKVHVRAIGRTAECVLTETGAHDLLLA